MQSQNTTGSDLAIALYGKRTDVKPRSCRLHFVSRVAGVDVARVGDGARASRLGLPEAEVSLAGLMIAALTGGLR